MTVSRLQHVLARDLARMTEEKLVEYVARMVKELVTHEVVEHLRFDGVRMFDPHQGERRGA